ncbi:hypothetical protein ASZ90_018753 [hydrocarbon metagenome]|uniref:Uncharacterized protein n=1 Tax=hydrocarbon metagenome TaxID=938273 RepID=A0A0W8E5C7_9ZZZZ
MYAECSLNLFIFIFSWFVHLISTYFQNYNRVLNKYNTL